MKAMIEFALPEDRMEMDIAFKAGAYFSALIDIQNHLRSKMKHGDLTDIEYKVYEMVREKFYEILNDREIVL